MSTRSIRRAQERKAAKEARKAASRAPLAGAEQPPVTESRALASGRPSIAVSEARLTANRANAKLSTGPVSESGKAISCLNAVKTNLTGRTVLLPSDDAETYRRHIAAYEAEYQPHGLRECELVQSLADTQWRLNRIPTLEMAIYAQGHTEFAGDFDDHAPELRSAMIELQTHTKYEKQLRNLHVQEARLVRRYQKEMAELRELQKAKVASNLQAAPCESTSPTRVHISSAANFAETAFDAVSVYRSSQTSFHFPSFAAGIPVSQATPTARTPLGGKILLTRIRGNHGRVAFGAARSTADE